MSSPTSPIKDLRIERPARVESSGAGWTVVLILLVLGAAGAGAYWWTTQPKGIPVRTAVVQEIGGGASATGAAAERTVLNASGYVTARREATVSSKVTAKVENVLVEEGMKVKAGQVLAQLDNTNVKASLTLSEAQLHATKAAMEETQVRLKEAERELARETELLKKKVSTEAEHDKAEAAVMALRAKLHQQQADIVVSEKTIGTWKQQMEDAIIKAPFDGVVTSKNAQPGEMISPMSAGGFTRTGICTIVDMQSLEIEIDVNESYINRVQPGQQVEATLDAYPDWKIPCKVIAIIPTADRQKSTVKVRVGFDKLDPRILPEMSVKVNFREAAGTKPTTAGDAPTTAARELAVPAAAVFEEGERDVIFVIKDNKAERRAVTVTSRTGDQAILSAGVAPGERVALEKPAGLSDGVAVKDVGTRSRTTAKN